MSFYGQVDGYIALAREGKLDPEDAREWFPEVWGLYGQLMYLYEKETRGLNANPDPGLAARIAGLRELITQAEVIGVIDPETGEQTWHPLPRDEAGED